MPTVSFPTKLSLLVAGLLIGLMVAFLVPVQAGSNWFQGKNRIERLERQVQRLHGRIDDTQVWLTRETSGINEDFQELCWNSDEYQRGGPSPYRQYGIRRTRRICGPVFMGWDLDGEVEIP